ncbi:MAG: transglutaminase-like domain-containing protein [Lentisphaerota bacterium]
MNNKDFKKQEKPLDGMQWHRPSRLSFHPAYIVFYGLSIISALWQHGHPGLTLALLIALIPCGLMAYVSYRTISSNYRFLIQLSIVLLAGGWFFYRMVYHVQLDKVLVESVCIVGLCFVFAQRREDYDYILLISMFLLVYGALLPRAIFIVIFFVALMLAMAILYSTRTRSLSGQPGILSPPGVLRRNWPHILIHIIISGLVFWFVFSIFPTEGKSGGGLFDVSFGTDNESDMPEFTLWFKPEKVKKSEKGRMEVQTGTPTSVGKTGAPMTVKNAESMSSSGNGGASPPGKDMIFRVKSPVKLYWLAQLYDDYDGNEWIISEDLKNKGGARDTSLTTKVISNNIEQNFIIEKWISNKLYAAYRPVFFENAGVRSSSIIESNFYHGWLRDKNYPALPFKYQASSEMYLPDVKKDNEKDDGITYWIEKLPQKHYLKLPRSQISRRLKLLTKRLTQNVQTPFEKAIILRNYLRENFQYKQFSRKVPAGREAADFFLFDLREGHCEYFASSLTVMSRLVGLPARVATGFSPGNYNALTGYFEVHEYHAHAWTQIYIEKMGWITFDATPPGEIISDTTPFAIGSLRDPFGDSWRVMPPELTKQTLATIRKGFFESLEQSDSNLNIAEKALVETAMAPEKVQEKLRNMLNSAMPNVKGEGFEKFKTLYDDIKASFEKMIKKAGDKIYYFYLWAKRHWAVVFPLFMIIIALFMEVKILEKYFYRRRLLKNCRQWFRRAADSAAADPVETVRLCYLTVRELLVLAEYPRQHNAELFEYGASLNIHDLQLAKDVVVVFFIYSRYEYGTENISQEDCQEILERTDRIRNFIYPLILESDELSATYS